MSRVLRNADRRRMSISGICWIGMASLTLVTPLAAQQVTIQIQPAAPAANTPQEPFAGNRPAVDVAILLDTSNSMDGLIQQAKSQLWKIVQQFSEAEKAGKTPILRVAVFEYGNTNLPASEGYIRQVVSLTDDLDKVSQALFALSTNGGDEYCGQVIDEALKRLAWNQEPNSYKAIFIAGNEPFTQGEVPYTEACSRAIQQGVIVNTIHCGNYQAGVSGMWKHGAEMAEGEYLNIDQDQKVVQIPAPQDKIIIELNQKLNRTYLWFGDRGVRTELEGNQIQQDLNAQQLGGSILATRGATKASKLYRNVGRDLVDTLEEDKAILGKLPVNQLPEAMQKMDPAEREKYVQKMAQERAAIKAELAKASAARELFIAKKRQELAEAAPAEATLGDAVTSAIGKQLKNSGFEVKGTGHDKGGN